MCPQTRLAHLEYHVSVRIQYRLERRGRIQQEYTGGRYTVAAVRRRTVLRLDPGHGRGYRGILLLVYRQRGLQGTVPLIRLRISSSEMSAVSENELLTIIMGIR